MLEYRDHDDKYNVKWFRNCVYIYFYLASERKTERKVKGICTFCVLFLFSHFLSVWNYSQIKQKIKLMPFQEKYKLVNVIIMIQNLARFQTFLIRTLALFFCVSLGCSIVQELNLNSVCFLAYRRMAVVISGLTFAHCTF